MVHTEKFNFSSIKERPSTCIYLWNICCIVSPQSRSNNVHVVNPCCCHTAFPVPECALPVFPTAASSPWFLVEAVQKVCASKAPVPEREGAPLKASAKSSVLVYLMCSDELLQRVDHTKCGQTHIGCSDWETQSPFGGLTYYCVYTSVSCFVSWR